MPPEISDFVYVTDDTYSNEQILQTEIKMFKAIDFNSVNHFQFISFDDIQKLQDL